MKVIVGKTIIGRKLGRRLGFPTVNIPYFGKKTGVFAGKVLLDGYWYVAAINLGGRPTVEDETTLCEAFLLDWRGNVETGTEIRVELSRKIRETRKFANLKGLKEQIGKDVELLKKWNFS